MERAFQVAASMDKQSQTKCYNGTDHVSTVTLIQHYFEKHGIKTRVAVFIYHFPLPQITMSKLKDDLLTPFNF